MFGSKFIKFLMSILKWQVNSSSNFVSFFIFMTHNSSVDFKFIVFLLWIKGSHQNPSFETFNCSGENLLYSCHFPNHKSVFLQILHYPSVSWKIIPLYIFRSNIILCTFFIATIWNIFVRSYYCKLFIIIFFYLIPQVIHSVFGVLPRAYVTCKGYFLI